MAEFRLNKVARELNVGIPTVVDFFEEKGVKLKPNPHQKINQEQYNMLASEFVKSASDKVEASELTIGEKIDDQINEPEQVKTKESPATISKISTNKIKISGPKVIGKIELEKEKSKKHDEALKKDDKPLKKDSKSDEVPEVKESKNTNKTQNTLETNKTPTEKQVPQKEFIKAETDVLKGLTIVKKIEISSKEPKEKPVASSDQNRKKRPRKRIFNTKIQDKNFSKAKRKPNTKTAEISEKEIQEKIKSTLAKQNVSKIGHQRSKNKKSKKIHRAEREEKNRESISKALQVTEFISANDLASLMDVSVNEVISVCISLGLFVSINQRLDAEIITVIADEFNYEVEFVEIKEKADIVEKQDDKNLLKERAPIITIMGHVDHGKTSLLDRIRSSKVTEEESGGITQHIGAYDVFTKSEKRITFLDTPGHQAFTAMRARGAKITDVVIIVVAADDSVMPQTEEAINHAKVAGVPMVIAINKIDKENANPEKIKEDLSKINILVEDWGGKFQCQHVSAKTGEGVEELLDKVLLEAELLELKANPDKPAVGSVIEASLDKGRGYVSTIMVQAGKLKIGDVLIAGAYFGKVKAMFDHQGQKLKEAGPSTPIQMLGLAGAPQAGDRFNVMNNEKEAKEIANKREQIIREQNIRTKKHITLDEIGRRLAIGTFKELNVIIKGDVDGSLEAISDELLKLSTKEIQINILHKAVGQISESDVLLASTSDAIIVGFQVRPSAGARKLAENEEIEIRLYSIIYKVIEDLRDAMEGMLEPKSEESITGNIMVREVFKISKIGTVAGSYVTEGTIKRSNKVRLIRDGIVIYTGEINQLKRFKNDVNEVKNGYECGLSIKNFNDLKVDDIIEGFEMKEVKRTL